MSKYGVISGPYFPIFRLNTGKYGPEITPYWDTFHVVHVFNGIESTACLSLVDICFSEIAFVAREKNIKVSLIGFDLHSRFTLSRGKLLLPCNVIFIFLQLQNFTWKLANKYIVKVNNESTRKMCEICSKLTIKIPQRRQWRRSVVVVVNFEHISHPFLVFLLLTLNK